MSTPPPPDNSAPIREALFAGNKIQAIKLHREQTGIGLKESKDAMDKLETELRAAYPERFSKPPAKGCFAVIVIVGLIGAAVWRVVA